MLVIKQKNFVRFHLISLSDKLICIESAQNQVILKQAMKLRNFLNYFSLNRFAKNLSFSIQAIPAMEL